MNMPRVALARISCAAILLSAASGCFEVKQTIKVKKDMSGTAAFDFKMDLEPMVYMMAFMQKAMSGGGDNPTITKSDLAKARKEFLANQGDDFKEKVGNRKEIESNLPPGVKIKKFKSNSNGTKMSVDALFAFDKVTQLNALDMKNAGESPVSGLKVEETATTLTILTTIDNPTKSAGGAMGPMGGAGGSPEDMPGPMGDVMRKALNAMKFNIVIEAPFKVKEHNATSKRGNKLTWTIDYKRMKAAEKTGDLLDVRVVYLK